MAASQVVAVSRPKPPEVRLPSDQLNDHFKLVAGFRRAASYEPPLNYRDGFEVWQWRQWARLQLVPLHRLIATNTKLLADRLQHHMRPGRSGDGGWDPRAVFQYGQLWLMDGHHRAVNAMLRGDTRFLARVMVIVDGEVVRGGLHEVA